VLNRLSKTPSIHNRQSQQFNHGPANQLSKSSSCNGLGEPPEMSLPETKIRNPKPVDDQSHQAGLFAQTLKQFSDVCSAAKTRNQLLQEIACLVVAKSTAVVV